MRFEPAAVCLQGRSTRAAQLAGSVELMKKATSSYYKPQVLHLHKLHLEQSALLEGFIANIVYIYISYVTSVRYVAGINHERRVIYSGNVPNRGCDMSNLCRHEPIAMVNGANILVLSP